MIYEYNIKEKLRRNEKKNFFKSQSSKSDN